MSSPSGYGFAQAFQLKLLAAVVRRPKEFVSIVEPQYFGSSSYVNIARLSRDAYEEHGLNEFRLKVESLKEIVRADLGERKKGLRPHYRRVVEELFKADLEDVPAIRKMAASFIKWQRYREAVIAAEKFVNNGQYEAVHDRFDRLRNMAIRNRSGREKPKTKLPVYFWEQLAMLDDDPEGEVGRHLVFPIIPREGAALCYGLPKELKSWFAAALAIDAACGRPALGFFPVPKPVKTLFVQVEDPKHQTAKRVWDLVRRQGYRTPSYRMFEVVPRCPLNLMDSEWRAEFMRYVAIFKPELIVLDVLRRLFRGNVNDPQHSAEFLAVLDEIRDLDKCAIVLVHHANKNELTQISAKGLGSVNWTAWPDALLYFSNKRRIGSTSVGDLQIETKSAISDEDELEISVDSEREPMVAVHEKGAAQFETVRDLLRDGKKLPQGQLIKKVGLPEKAGRKLLEKWAEKGWLTVQRGEGKTLFYSLPDKGRAKERQNGIY
ncbi:MAG: AAA family ATPase [Acidobacteriia bacterium]|nr:AAA family ATPase [Terriglobia bacterium]